jgi:hypothetical protein
MENIFKEVFDDKEIVDGLKKIEEAVKGVAEQSEAMTDTVSSAIDDLADSLDSAAGKIADQSKVVEKAEKANGRWSDSIRQTVLGIQIGGKSLGEWSAQIQGFTTNTAGAERSLGGLSKGVRLFGTALKAAGIGLIIGLVASLIQYFTKFQSGIDKVNRVLAAGSAVISQIVDRFLLLAKSIESAGKAIQSLFTLDFAGFKRNAVDSMNAFSEATDNLAGSLRDAAEAAYELERRKQSLRDASLTASVTLARERVQIEELKRAYQDESKTFSERTKARKDAFEREKRLADEELDRALEARQIAEQEFLAQKENGQLKEALAQAEIFLLDAVAGRNALLAEGEKDLKDLRKTASDARKKSLEEESKLLERLFKDLESLRIAAQADGLEKDLAVTEKRYNDLIKVAVAGEAKLLEIASKRRLTPEEEQALTDFAQFQVDLEKRKYEAIQKVFEDYVNREIEQDEARAREQERIRKEGIAGTRAEIDARRDLAAQDLELQEIYAQEFLAVLRSSGASERSIKEAQIDFDRQFQRLKIEGAIEYNQQLIELLDDADTLERERLQNSIRNLKAQLDVLDAQAQDTGQKRTIWDLLGIEDPETLRGIFTAFDSVIDSLSMLADARLRDAEAAVQAADMRVRASEEALRKEEADAEKGFANNVDLRKRELDEAKKARDLALQEEAKARRAQIALDSLGQASGLVTASANIFASVSKIPVVGVPLAIATIALMFGAFAKARADALKAAQPPKLRRGMKFDGPTHEQGNEDLVFDGRRTFAVEKGEWLIGSEHSREHDGFLSMMNKGKFRGVDLVAAVTKSDSGPFLGGSVARIESLSVRRAALESGAGLDSVVQAYEAGTEKIVREIRQRPVVMPWKSGYKIVRKTGSGTDTEIVEPSN